MLPDLITSIAALVTSIGAFVASLISARRAGKAENASSIAAAEVSHNHGGTLKDAIARIELATRHISEVQRSQGHQIGEIRRDKVQAHEFMADRLSEHSKRLDRLERD